MIIGYLLIMFGIGGSLGIYSYMSKYRGYAYTSKFAEHEMVILTILFMCILMLIVGILIIIIAIIRKNSSDTLQRLQNMQENGKKIGVCPACGINLANNTQICPKCGLTLKSKGE